MARDRDEDRWRKKRREEDAQDNAVEEAKRTGISISGDSNSGALEDKVEEIFKRAEPLIEQLNSLYNQFMVGVEHRPPIERRKQLDQLMLTLQMVSKPTPQQQFRAANLQQTYNTYRNRWDKMVKDVENGVIKRVAGPKKAG